MLEILMGYNNQAFMELILPLSLDGTVFKVELLNNAHAKKNLDSNNIEKSSNLI